MAWTQADIDKLDTAIASGVQSVTYDGPPRRNVTYHSLADMLAARAVMTAEIVRAAKTTRVRYACTKKGF